jgi:phage terminase large subunit-like protein
MVRFHAEQFIVINAYKMRVFEEMMEEGMNLAIFANRIYTDFKFFYEKVLGFGEKGGLNKYKKEWFNLAYENDRVMIKAPSGFAKTTVLGVAFPIWWAFTNPNCKILLISKTLSQSKDALLIQIRDLIEDNEFLRKVLMPEDRDKIWNQTQLKLANGVTIVNRPYSMNIKGYRANIIICDEIDSYEDPNIYFDYVVPRLIPGGKIIGISTPEEGTSTLMELINLRDRGTNEYIFETYLAIVDVKDPKDLSTGESIWPEMFSIDELMRRRRELGEQKWQKNYMCNAMTEAENSIFKASIIESCKNYDLKFTTINYGEEIYIGCDFAISSSPTGDYDAFVVIGKKKDVGTIKYAERWKGIDVPEKVKRIKELYTRYNAICVIGDNSGIGKEVIRQLRIEGLSVEEQGFSSGERNILLNNLLALMANKKIVIPKHQDDLQAIEFANVLEYELFSFREVKSLSSGHTSYVSKGTHDDTVMGLAMAVKYIQLLQEFEDYIGSASDSQAKQILEELSKATVDPNASFKGGIPIK